MVPVYFLIYSRGRTATQWIARALSSVPGVMCSHALDPQPYAQRSAVLRQADTHALVASGPPNVDSYFDLLEARPFSAYGNIHGFDPVTIGPTRRTYRLARITREPLARAASFAAKWRHDLERGVTPPALKAGADDLDRLALELVLADDRRTWPASVRAFRMEDVTVDPAAFAGLCEHVAGITPTEETLAAAMGAAPLDAFRGP